MVVSKRLSACAVRMRSLMIVLSLGGALGACASAAPDSAPFMPLISPSGAAPQEQMPPAAPQHMQARQQVQAPSQGAAPGGGVYKVGAPYQSGGVWYVPAEQPNYDETGLASWYGDAFNGKATANGEIFDMYGVSGAHATLPMPSIVEVTNLDNGRTLQVRMNDRGPFHPGRVIDLSRGAADRLGFAVAGTAHVRVRYVGPASLNGVGAPVIEARNDETPPPYAPSAHSPRMIQPAYQTLAPPPERAVMPSPATSGGAYSVQAGAFSTRETAERVAASLSTAGAPSVAPMPRGERTLYRVMVGAWGDAQAAHAAREKVVALGCADARVVPGL